MIDGFGTNDLILIVVLYGGATLFGIIRAARYPSASQVTAWMVDHGLSQDNRARQDISRYLRRTRWIRTIGFLVGFNVPFAWMWVTRSAYRMNEAPHYWWVIGFALGILLAEIFRPRSAGTASSIEPRRLAQYLPGFTRLDRWILSGFALLALAGSMMLPVAQPVFPNDDAIPRNEIGWYLALTLVAITIIVVTRLVQEWIVHRRQSFEDLDDMRADDAMRSTSIQGLAGLGYGAPMLITATMAWDLVVTSRGILSSVIALASLFLGAAGLGMLLGFPRMNTKWTVPRARTSA